MTETSSIDIIPTINIGDLSSNDVKAVMTSPPAVVVENGPLVGAGDQSSLLSMRHKLTGEYIAEMVSGIFENEPTTVMGTGSDQHFDGYLVPPYVQVNTPISMDVWAPLEPAGLATEFTFREYAITPDIMGRLRHLVERGDFAERWAEPNLYNHFIKMKNFGIGFLDLLEKDGIPLELNGIWKTVVKLGQTIIFRNGFNVYGDERSLTTHSTRSVLVSGERSDPTELHRKALLGRIILPKVS